MRKRKILAVNDYGNTGIAESLQAPLRHWHDTGHEIWQLGLGYTGWNAGMDKEKYPWWERLLPIYGNPDPGERFGQKLIQRALEASGADIVITAFDIWMVGYLGNPARAPELSPEIRKYISHRERKFKHIAYFPIDGGVFGRHVPAGLDELIAGFDVAVTYSRFAKDMIYRDTHLDIPFIPISHDPKIFYPDSKIEARKTMGFNQDDFIVAMVATNQYRKLWGQFFEACAPFAAAHPNVKIIPWTDWDKKLAGGAEIGDLVYRFGFDDAQVLNPKDYVGKVTDEQMATFYRSLDVLVLLTVGEGAGLPPIRARACGVPTLVSDNTSNTEFTVDEFERIPQVSSFYDPIGSNLERYTSDVAVVTERLEKLYADKFLCKRLSKMGILGMSQYENEKIVPYWDDILEGLE